MNCLGGNQHKTLGEKEYKNTIHLFVVPELFKEITYFQDSL